MSLGRLELTSPDPSMESLHEGNEELRGMLQIMQLLQRIEERVANIEATVSPNPAAHQELTSAKAAKEVGVNNRRFWSLVREFDLRPIPGKPRTFRRSDILKLRDLIKTDFGKAHRHNDRQPRRTAESGLGVDRIRLRFSSTAGRLGSRSGS